jgi:predicted anti-sigma-YlaC factor YlaD
MKLDCRQASRLLSDGADQQMAPADRARLRLHLVICDACRNVEEQFTFLRRAMRQLGSGEPPPGGPGDG